MLKHYLGFSNNMNYINISDNHKPHTSASMGSRADLTDRERGVISRLRQRGMKPERIALRMNFCRRTVSRVWKRFQETGSGKRKTRSGRRKKTTARCDRVLRRLALEHRFSSIGRIHALWNENIGVETSPRTSKRRLNKMNMHSRIARRKPLIGVENRLKRVRWCTRIRLWNADDNWSRLVFSDESKFNLDFDDGRVRVWRENRDAMLPGILCVFVVEAMYRWWCGAVWRFTVSANWSSWMATSIIKFTLMFSMKTFYNQ